MMAQQEPTISNSGSQPVPASTDGYATVDEIAPQYRLSTETLRGLHTKSHGCGHFAALLLPNVFPELFGPLRARLNYNWEGYRNKEAPDSERKKVLKTYVNMYYPETRVGSSRSSCVLKINKTLRR